MTLSKIAGPPSPCLVTSLGNAGDTDLFQTSKKIMLFGGMNLSSYCESVVYDIHIDDNAVFDFLIKPSSLKPEQQSNGFQLDKKQ